MRHRATACRRRLPCAHLGGVRTAVTRRNKAFIKREDEDGGVYYTVATKEEGKQMPKQPGPGDLFEMPDLVIDLDGARQDQVREANSNDEASQAGAWNVSSKAATVDQKMKWLSNSLEKLRSQAAIMERFHATRPLTITECDVMSAALRGTTTTTAWSSQKGDVAEGPKVETESEQGQPQPKRFVITALNQLQRDETHRLPAASLKAKPQEVMEEDGRDHSLRNQIRLGDPRRPDYMFELRRQNGIPSYVMDEDERLIRWMLLRDQNLRLGREKAESTPLKDSHIAKGVQEQATSTKSTRANILNIRRLVFQSLSAGLDLSISGASGKAQNSNLPLVIRDACAWNLDHSERDPPHYPVLTFANNLGHRLPERTGDMDACISGLRLRALAGLGLTDLTVAHLEGLRPDKWDGMVDVLKDVEASMQTWLIGLKENPVLQTEESRRNLFRALTGYDATGEPLVNSYRSLISHNNLIKKGSEVHTELLAACGTYFELLGRLGAVRTLWKEREALSELLPDSKENKTGTETATHFQQALAEAVSVGDLSVTGKDVSLGACAKMDYSTIVSWSGITAGEDGQHRASQATEDVALALQKLEGKSNVSLDEWLEYMKSCKASG